MTQRHRSPDGRRGAPLPALGRSIAIAGLVLAWACDSPENGPTGSAQDREPPPASSIIEEVRFAPLDSVVILADGSDNWPTTWGDDNALYVAYGDGWGFEPMTELKLSLGVARVTGGPEDFEAINIRAPTVEATGDGPSGAKANGLLMVDGVLYMSIRNVGSTARLAWSTDRGATWTWGPHFPEGFTHPSFLNFGPNYEGARDGYVYVYSPENLTYDDWADRVLLARVPVDRIREPGAYEFFVRRDADGPVWSADPDDRGAVYVDPDRCANAEVIYVPPLDRYLMTVNANSEGAWGIYDAPEPWGPWTTAFETEQWDAGTTYSYVFPAKWISDDGRILHLIFSGREHEGVNYDAFALRRVELVLADR